MGLLFALAMSIFFPVTMTERQLAVHSERLPNGVQIIASFQPHAPYFVASLWVNRGSASDPPNREGTAHLLEHLLPLKPFNDTTVQIAMERQGTLLIPETGRDFMAFHLQASDAQTIVLVFPLLVNAVSELTVDPKVLEREKQLIWLETLALYEDPLWLMKTWLEAKLFEGTSYAHPPTGWLETVNQLSDDDVLQFHRSHFVAPNFALVAVVPDEKALTDIKGTLAFLPSGLTPSPSPISLREKPFSPTFEPLLQKTLARFRDALWGIGWRLPVSGKEQVAADALVLYLRQILLPNIFGQIGVVQEWNLVANPVKGEIALTVSVRLRPHTDLVERRILQALQGLAKNGLAKSELDWLRERLRLDRFRAVSDPTRLARQLGWAWALHGDLQSVERYGEMIENLDGEQIRQLALRLASTKPVAVLVKK